MAFVFTDGFDSYGATADLTKKWVTLSNSTLAWNATAGRFGGGGLTGANSSTQSALATPIIGAMPSFYIGYSFFCKISGNPVSSMSVVMVGNGSSTWTDLVLDSAGKLELWSWNSSIATANFVITDNVWHYVEVLDCYANSTQARKITIDGTNYVNVSNNWNGGNGTVLAPNYMMVCWGGVTGTTLNGLDDFIVYDDLGASPKANTNYPLGPRQITTIRPSADSAVQFSRSSGATNYSLVNEVGAPDGDTSYVQDGTAGDQDLYDFDDISFSPAAISGVTLNGVMNNPGGAYALSRVIAKSNSLQADGGVSLVPIPSYKTIQQEYGFDPGVAAPSAWTQSAINAAKFGVKVAYFPSTAWDPQKMAGNMTLSSDRFQVTNGGSSGIVSVLGNVGYAQGGAQKLYLEFYCWALQVAGGSGVGLAIETLSLTQGPGSNAIVITRTAGAINNNGSSSLALGDPTSGNVVNVAVDIGNRNVWFRYNGGNWNGSSSADPATNSGGLSISGWFTTGHTLYPCAMNDSSAGSGGTIGCNFGQGKFYFPRPSGFTAWDGTSN